MSVSRSCSAAPPSFAGDTRTEANPLEQSRPIRPGQPRWMEDYRFLDDLAKRTDSFDAFRFHRLSDTAWLQLGGEARLRADHVSQPLFGRAPVSDDSYWQHRLQLHADLHLLDDRLRAFLQVEDTRSHGQDLVGPRDQGRSDVHQAFLESNWVLDDARLGVRLGRQEMAYGAHALVTYAETPNIRQNFDGLRTSLSAKDGRRLELFAVRPVAYDKDDFDDGSDDSTSFYGLYGTLPWGQGMGVDLYGMGIERDQITWNGRAGAEARYTLGTRLYGQRAGFDWSWDVMHQFGDFEGKDISAWSLWGEGGYTLQNPWKLRLGMRLDASSGDRDPNDGELNTFDPLYTKTGVYGEAGLIAPANLIAVGPVLGFSPHRDVRVEPAIFRLWRQSDEDAVYLPGTRAVPGSAAVSGHDLGTSYRVNTRWTPTANLTLDLDYQFYDTGSVFQRLGGKGTHFISLRTSFRF